MIDLWFENCISVSQRELQNNCNISNENRIRIIKYIIILSWNLNWTHIEKQHNYEFQENFITFSCYIFTKCFIEFCNATTPISGSKKDIKRKRETFNCLSISYCRKSPGNTFCFSLIILLYCLMLGTSREKNFCNKCEIRYFIGELGLGLKLKVQELR